jgi:hypothetical protein
MLLIKIYLAGLVVLVVAVLLNVAAGWLGLSTWYSFLLEASQKGLYPALQSLNAADYLFLFLFYPGLLGLAAYLIFRAVSPGLI